MHKTICHKVSAELPQSYKISKEQFDYYEKYGYLVIKELIDFSTLYSCKQRFIKMCKGLVEVEQVGLVRDPELAAKGLTGENAVNKVQGILYDEVFSLYTENPRLLDVVAQFIGDDIRAIHSMFINKPPGTCRHPSHQDLFYLPYRPAEKMIASWTAVDDVTEENGALFVLPGSHKSKTLQPHSHLPDTANLYHGITEEEALSPKEARVPLAMSPGDTVFFHPLLVHGSGPNTTRQYRKSISCHYANSTCELIDLSNTEQAHLAREVENALKKKGYDFQYSDIFRFKSKLVQRLKSNL